MTWKTLRNHPCMAQPGRALRSGRRDWRFESSYTDSSRATRVSSREYPVNGSKTSTPDPLETTTRIALGEHVQESTDGTCHMPMWPNW